MKIEMPITITSANDTARTISGRVVTWNETGATSAGLTSFSADSVKASKVKLLLEHDRTRPIGKVLSMTSTSDGIDAVFKIAATTAGNDALVEASTGLRDGFSVGVNVDAWDNKDGVMIVTAGSLAEVSLVTEPAIKSAIVSEVAASETENSEPIKESEEPTTKGDEVETSTVTEAPAAEAVEAAHTVQAKTLPVAYTSLRSPIISGGSYLEHTIKATLGNEDSKLYIRAANDSFTTNPAFSPVAYVRDITSATTGLRPTIDACGGAKAMSGFGMTVSFPKITTNVTSAVVAEGASTTGTTQMVSAYVNATVQKISSYNVYSLELLERSDPSFYSALLQNIYDSYAVASDAAVIAEIVSGGTQGATVAATSAGIISYVSTEVPAAYNATKKLPDAYIAGTSQWGLLMGATDTTGRPIYNAQPTTVNSGGVSSPTSLRGNVLGLNLYVDPNMVATTIDDSAFIVSPGAIGIQESPQATLQANITATGEVSILYYGYLATKTLISGGLRRFNLT